MRLTIAAPSSDQPPAVGAMIVEIKPPSSAATPWSMPWTPAPELRLTRLTAATAGHDLGRAELEYRYGVVKLPHLTPFATQKPKALTGFWLRVRLVDEGGDHAIWHGIIGGDQREMSNSVQVDGTGATIPVGIQKFIAYEPMHLLRRITLANSVWTVGGTVKLIDWIPAINLRDARGRIIGNRSAVQVVSGASQSYVYGGDSEWSNHNYLQYLLNQFVDESLTGGPAWSITGQYALLHDIRDTIEIGRRSTIADVVRALVPPRWGVDFNIIPTPTGFAVDVFTLTATPWSFGGVTLPRNGRSLSIDLPKHPEIVATQFAKTSDHSYDAVRINGGRCVCCCTLRAEDGSLVPKWNATLESQYVAGTGNALADPIEHDDARKRDIFAPVYQHHGAPTDWNHQDGAANPALTVDGKLAQASNGQFQNLIRSTLSHLPLREGFDYSTAPPRNLNPAEYEAPYLQPLLWVRDPETGRHVPANETDPPVHVGGLENDWGIAIKANPNHLVALGHFTGDSDIEPLFDYAGFVCTIAFETDTRLSLFHAVPGARAAGGILEIDEPNAELWYVAPGTVVGVQATGEFIVSPNQSVVLRNDAPRLALTMAGAIARYVVERGRSILTYRGLWPLNQFLGHVLRIKEPGTDGDELQAPVTAIEWELSGSPRTILRSGYAS